MPSEKQPSPKLLIQIADQLESALIEAGEAILARYRLPEHAIQTKADLTPVTDADIASHDLLCDALARVTPDWPVVSEEDGAPADQDPALSTTNSTTNSTPYWLLDPLDGTKEFIARTGEFSINLGLVIDADAFFGLLYGPLDHVLYRGGKNLPAQRRQQDSAWERIGCRRRPSSGGVVIASRRSAATPHDANFERREYLGSALKFARIAEGSADVYLRQGPTMEWDTCAGQAIVEAAGGSLCDLSGSPLRYGKINRRNPGFIAQGLKAAGESPR